MAASVKRRRASLWVAVAVVVAVVLGTVAWIRQLRAVANEPIASSPEETFAAQLVEQRWRSAVRGDDGRFFLGPRETSVFPSYPNPLDAGIAESFLQDLDSTGNARDAERLKEMIASDARYFSSFRFARVIDTHNGDAGSVRTYWLGHLPDERQVGFAAERRVDRPEILVERTGESSVAELVRKVRIHLVAYGAEPWQARVYPLEGPNSQEPGERTLWCSCDEIVRLRHSNRRLTVTELRVHCVCDPEGVAFDPDDVQP